MKPIVRATINSHIVTLKTTNDYGLEMSIALMGLMLIKTQYGGGTHDCQR